MQQEYCHELCKSTSVHIRGYIAMNLIITLVYVSVITLCSFTIAAVSTSYYNRSFFYKIL